MVFMKILGRVVGDWISSLVDLVTADNVSTILFLSCKARFMKVLAYSVSMPDSSIWSLFITAYPRIDVSKRLIFTIVPMLSKY